MSRRGYSLRETVVRAKLANWTDISDVALLKRPGARGDEPRLTSKLRRTLTIHPGRLTEGVAGTGD
jgi:hypothetical protein